ncbi:acyl carrier protein [Kitasatospora sp. NA04385]|uniref:acyl carrier protein n=1 Tax=Kitasatospora sp. NA04385 TaxID=2742135 RepID=UPI0020CAAB19|nr:acyl carrier protein [Kitasatospora sp. NA04385]
MSTDAGTRFGRSEAVAMLARYGDRAPEQVDEHLGSLELTWLIAEAEQQYGVQIDLDDERLDAIRTVDDAVAALGAQIDAATDDAARIDAATADAATAGAVQGLGAGAAAP